MSSDACFLGGLPLDSISQGLSCLYAAAGQIPAVEISVPDENCLPCFDRQQPDAHCRWSGETPVQPLNGMQKPC